MSRNLHPTGKFRSSLSLISPFKCCYFSSLWRLFIAWIWL